jgi:hypothetical protein
MRQFDMVNVSTTILAISQAGVPHVLCQNETGGFTVKKFE